MQRLKDRAHACHPQLHTALHRYMPTQAAEAAALKEQMGQALQVLSRPGASARSISHHSGCSSASGGSLADAPLCASGGAQPQQKLRGAQRQLAAKLASRLRSGSTGGGSTGGSQAGSGGSGEVVRQQRLASCELPGGEAGGGWVDGEGCGGEGGASDTREPHLDTSERHGAWLSSGTREQLARMTKR